MPRKRLSPLNPSQDEGYSEEIQSDSSLESNSRRNTRRKKPQRKDSSKQNRINLLLQSTNEKRKEKPQGNTLEKNGKRPSIIKIFRRIDRKAKHIYLVDDKMEDRNELITPPEPKCYLNIPIKGKSSCSIESPYHEKSLFSDCTGRRSATTVEEHSIRTTKTDHREQNDLGEVDVDSSYSSATDIDQIYNKTDASNMPRDIDASYSLVTNIDQEPNKSSVWNMHRDDAVFDQTASGSDVYSQLLSSYSDTSNFSEVSDDQTSNAADVCFQQSSSDFDASVSGSDEIPNESNSSENSTAIDVCIQQSSNDFDASVIGGDEISNDLSIL